MTPPDSVKPFPATRSSQRLTGGIRGYVLGIEDFLTVTEDRDFAVKLTDTDTSTTTGEN